MSCFHAAPVVKLTEGTLADHPFSLSALRNKGLQAKFPELKFDRGAVCFGAASHDLGKVLQQNELTGPGNQHEADRPALLEQYGVQPNLARFARTHGRWAEEALPLEDLIVALSDTVCKGQRLEELEKQVVSRITEQTGIEQWEAFLELDALLERITCRGDERLAWQRTNG